MGRRSPASLRSTRRCVPPWSSFPVPTATVMPRWRSRLRPAKSPSSFWHDATELPTLDLIVLPGGFAHGDYLRAGAMAARSPIMREIIAASGRGVPVLGICNGFQVLTEAGLLPGVLMRNAGLRFICRDVNVRIENAQSPFLSSYDPGAVIRLPIAHADGNYYADPDVLSALEDNGQVAFRYVDAAGEVSDDANPNGSAHNIAGIYNDKRTVLGFMPHPERASDPATGGVDGKALFDGLARALS